MTTMKTPAGEMIEVVSDADFCEVYDVNPIDLRIWAPKAPVFMALWHEGACRSKNGRATAQLWLNAQRYGYQANQSGLNGLFNGATMLGAIEREMNGKRTYLIRLARLPESYVEKLRETKSKLVTTKLPKTEAKATGDGDLTNGLDEITHPDRINQFTPRPHAPTFEEAKTTILEAIDKANEPEPPPEAEALPTPEAGAPLMDVAEAVAQQLLAQVIALVTAPPPEPVVVEVVPEGPSPELVEARDRLAKSLEYSQRLRRELQEASNKLAHMTSERDALATRIAVAESQLQRALGTEGRSFVNDEVRRVLAGIMGQAPGSKKGSDDV